MAHRKLLSRCLTTITVAIFAVAWVESAAAQSAFYKGKTITIVQGRSPGGQGDVRVRALLPILQKNIPGNPAIVSEYMDGGGGRKAANHMFRVARPDGLTIANIARASCRPSSAKAGAYDIDSSLMAPHFPTN